MQSSPAIGEILSSRAPSAMAKREAPASSPPKRKLKCGRLYGKPHPSIDTLLGRVWAYIRRPPTTLLAITAEEMSVEEVARTVGEVDCVVAISRDTSCLEEEREYLESSTFFWVVSGNPAKLQSLLVHQTNDMEFWNSRVQLPSKAMLDGELDSAEEQRKLHYLRKEQV